LVARWNALEERIRVSQALLMYAPTMLPLQYLQSIDGKCKSASMATEMSKYLKYASELAKAAKGCSR